MFLPHWFVPGFFAFVCLVIVIKAKHLWLRSMAVLFGAIFLWTFLSGFMRDTTSLVMVFLLGMLMIGGVYWRSLRKARKRADYYKGV